MKNAIELAIKGGWKTGYATHKMKKAYGRLGSWMEKGNTSSFLDWKHALLDPIFWKALGKSLGLSQEEVDVEIFETEMLPHLKVMPWIVVWHNFIDHIAEGGDIDEFFNKLIK